MDEDPEAFSRQSLEALGGVIVAFSKLEAIVQALYATASKRPSTWSAEIQDAHWLGAVEVAEEVEIGRLLRLTSARVRLGLVGETHLIKKWRSLEKRTRTLIDFRNSLLHSLLDHFRTERSDALSSRKGALDTIYTVKALAAQEKAAAELATDLANFEWEVGVHLKAQS